MSSRQDVIVVGAGAIGLTSAWRLAQHGLAVTVLERDEPGSGATHVSAGMLAPVTEAEFGDEPMLEERLAAAAAWPNFAAELADAGGVATGYRRNGCLSVALDADEIAEIRRHHDFRLELGLDAEWLLPSACRDLEPALSTRTAGGSYTPDDGEVDPRTLTAALLAALDNAGATVRPQAAVIAAELDGDRITGVRTSDGTTHEADTVILAAGCWSGACSWLPELARPAVRPVKGQIVRLRGPANDPVVVRTIRTAEIYIVPRATGEVVVGATVEEHGFDTTVTAGAVHELLREAYRAVPELAELELAEASAGLRPGTPDNVPFVERGALDGLVIATGHYRNGILLAPTAAARVAELVAEKAAA